MITDYDERMFTRGGCLVLAEMISEQTGWPICALNTEDEPDEPDIHAFVQTPDGHYLDIEGKHTADEMMGRWSVWNPVGIAEYYPEDFQDDWIQRGKQWSREYEQRGEEILPELLAMA